VLLIAPAFAFASSDDSTVTESSLTADQSEPADQSGGFDGSTTTGQFDSPVGLDQDTTTNFSEGLVYDNPGSDNPDTGINETGSLVDSDTTPGEQELLPPEAGASNADDNTGINDYPSLETPSPSQLDEQTEPAEVNTSGETETSDLGDNGTNDGQDLPSLETEGSSVDDTMVSNTNSTATVYFQVAEVSMSPLLNPGAIVEVTSETYADGDMVVAQKSDGTYIVKMLDGDRLVPLGAGESYDAADVTILGAAVLSSLTAEDLDLSGLSWYSVLAETSTPPTVGNGSSESPYEIAIWENLYWLSQTSSAWDKHFIQTADITFPGNPVEKNDGIYLWDSNKGWSPIGPAYSSSFTGTYNGNSYTISNLYINRPDEDDIGLFGYTTGTVALQNITLANINVTGKDRVGGLVGHNYGTINDSSASGTVDGISGVGGLVGMNNGTISNSSTTVAVVGADYIGGLVGINSVWGAISNSYASGTVSGNRFVGGLVGYNYEVATVSSSYATGNVTGESTTNIISESVGGLVGINNGAISNSHAEGTVNGVDSVGGLVGTNYDMISNSYSEGAVDGIFVVGGLVGHNKSGTIRDCYATGAVTSIATSSPKIGGLVGHNEGGSISNCYSSGIVALSNFSMIPIDFKIGGLVGDNTLPGTISSSYWDKDTSGMFLGHGGTGMTTSEMQQLNTYDDWDISDQGGESTIWRIYEGYSYPLLRSFMTVVTAVKTYDGDSSIDQATDFFDSESSHIVIDPELIVTGTYADKNARSNKVVTFDFGPSGDSNAPKRSALLQQYDFKATGNITTRDLTLSNFSADDKIYDSTTDVLSGDGFDDNRLGTDALTFKYTVAFIDKNVGIEKGVSFTGIVISGGADQNNYTLVTTSGNAIADITARSLKLSSFVAGDKVYDGTTDVTGAGFDDDRFGTDVLIFSYNVAFDDEIVGTDKNVNFTSIAISGGVDQNNYTLVTTSGIATADITARSLNLSSFVASDKEYDGTTAVLSGVGFNDDRVAGDVLTFNNYDVAFADKNVGTGKDVNFTNIAISGGSDAGNYTLVTTSGTAKANITARDLALSNFVAGSKVYDGTTDVTGAGFNDDRVAGDVLSFNYDVAFVDNNVGIDKDVNFTCIAISGGADAGNYSLVNTSSTAKGNITPKNLTITANDITKLYYSTYTFTGTEFSMTGLVSGDEVTFADIVSAGAPETALPGEYIISIGNAVGTGLSNYNITYVQGKMRVVLPTFGSFSGFDTQDLDLSDPFAIRAVPGEKPLTDIKGGVAAYITPDFVSNANQFNLAQAVLAYQVALQRYEEGKELLTGEQKALYETELAIARAAIMVMEARLSAAEGLPYNLATLQAAYAEALETANAHQSYLSAGQLTAANQLLAAIAGVMAKLQQMNT